ncbi:MAG: hypothetical protein A3J38_08485 [Gammaproteobacteria bacterium RIFCSPHIGHO2_12_FULL_45_9]|nr:MAG: hypothetical protein A3J38_08485 [Gammaproteobacteria bacterium RIFCSPHIGHO2_12_FULL_45_9]
MAFWLVGATVLWALAYDTAYAMEDVSDDVRIGLHSTARLWGRWVVEGIFLCELGMLFCLFEVGQLAGLGFPYMIAVGLSWSFFCWQYVCLKRNMLSGFAIFMQHQWVGPVMWLGLLLS